MATTDWGVTPKDISVEWEHLTPYPPIQIIKIEAASNYFPGLTSTYSDFRIQVIQSIFNNGGVFYEVFDSNLTNDGYINNAGVTSLTVKVRYLNLENQIRINQGAIIFKLFGKDTSGNWQNINNANVLMDLLVKGNKSDIKTEKPFYTVYYNKDSGTLSGETLVKIINNTDNKALEFENEGTFATPASFTTQFNLNLSSNPALPSSGEKNVPAFLWTNGVRFYAFSIQVLILDNGIAHTPQDMSFFIRKSTNEILLRTLRIINPFNKSFTVTGPSWLTLSATSGTGNAFIDVRNVAPATLAAGDYSGDIKILFESHEIVVPVTMKVVVFYNHNFTDEYNFCLDNKILNVFKYTENAFFARINMEVLVKTPEKESVLTVPLTIPYFKDKCTVNIGEKINRYFIKNREEILSEPGVPNHFDNHVLFLPAVSKFTIEELDIDHNLLHKESFENIKFYPGKRPKCFPFLTNYNVRSHVEDSKTIFSFISGLVSSGELLDNALPENSLPQGSIARVKVEDSEQKINFGESKVITAGGQSLNYFTMPILSENRVNVQWENQNLAMESITFTGDYALLNEYSHIIQKNVFTGDLDKFSTDRVRKININTGFILKAETDLIDELVASLYCLLEIEGRYYSAKCISQKLTKEDSKRSLIEFDLEFQVS